MPPYAKLGFAYYGKNKERKTHTLIFFEHSGLWRRIEEYSAPYSNNSALRSLNVESIV